MFIAHLPAGYLLTATLLTRLREVPIKSITVFGAGLIGAMAPDLDLIYFYFVDNCKTHHHKYLTHWPLLWFLLLVVGVLWWKISRKSKGALLLMVGALNAFGHILLDSFVGDIWWFAPFLDKPFALFTVSSGLHPWWLNFICHWSFAVELTICIGAILLFLKRRNRI